MRPSRYCNGPKAGSVADYLADILRVFHNHNLFHEGVELIGSWCFNDYEVKRLFDSLPKKWRQNILQTVKNAGNDLPLLNKESERLFLTLQSKEKSIK